MKRLNNMLESVEELMLQLTKAKQKSFETWALTHSAEIKEVLMKVVKGGKEVEGSQLLITYLRSSYITKTHEFKISLYLEEPFIEEPLASAYYSLSQLFLSVSDDMKIIKKALNNSFIRIRSCEIEEIRRRYSERIYAEAKILFQVAIKDNMTENSLQVYFGSEMGMVEFIGHIYF